MKTPMTKLMLAAVAALSICLGARAASTHDKVQLWEGGPYWATTNIGAENPEDYGYYFWWGDTVGCKRENNAWVAVDGSNNNFSFSDSTTLTWNKDNTTLLSEGYIDLTGNLVAAHDAATAHWGASWRMPTSDEFAALISNCTITWITTNGVNGRLVTGKDAYADKSIFLPAAGYGNGTGIASPGNDCNHYSSSPDSSNSYRALFLGSNSSTYQQISYYRYIGMPVRPVWHAAVVDLSSKTDAYTAQDGDVLTGATVKCTVSIPHGATVMLSNVTIERTWQYSPSIICLGDATIILADGTLNTLVGTLKVGGAGTTLVIEGNTGELVATGNGSSAGIGAVSGTDCGNIVINGGIITANGTASSGYGGAGIGAGRSAGCGNITINGGIITATAGGTAAGIGGTGYYGPCGDITIAATIAQVEATKGGSYGGKPLNSNYNVTIADGLVRSGDDNAITWVIEPIIKYDITWLNGDGTEIDTTIVPGNAVPTHADPTKAAEAPYRWVFTGWTPELEAAVSNTTYTATFKKIADLSLVESDWTAADGDEIVGEATHEVTIPGGAHVTINGVAVAGAGGGAANPPPAFASGGKAATTEFVQGEGGKWTLTTFAELSNDALGADVAAEQIKVYAADTVEGLESASPMASGVEVTEKKSAVKTTIEVTPPGSPAKQFFKVKFGE